MEFEEDEPYAANSELRYITLELMKIAEKKGATFDEMARDYVNNTFKLKKLIEERDLPEKVLKTRKEPITDE